MSFRIFSCVACGRPFYDYDDRDPSSWLTQFRILYSSPGGISVSGVGLHNEIFTGEFIVHLEYTSRWDDPKYLFIEGVPIGVMTLRPINDRHGFIFHEACWYLLEKIYHPESVPCSRLYEVCKSMPLSKRGAANISWGHDYGGLLLSDNDSVHPGQRMIFNLSADRELRFSASMDPMCGPEIRRLLEPVRSLPFLDIEQFKRSVDVFSKLPREIRDMIACLLPMPDVLNLRLASWSFISLFENQQFWASRFGPAFERSWLFELWESSGYKNWRWLYLHTAASKLPPALQNRKRIWELLEHVKDITNLQWKEVFHASVPHADVPGWKYRKIAADVKPETPLESDHDFDKGCRLLRQQNVAVPQLVSQVAVSTVQVGDTEYVSGMRVVSSEGAVTEFGYWSGKKEYSVNITSLGGFNVAIGSRGIQAIQVLDEELTSRWLGFADECPKTQYLAVSRPIKSIEAGFDACKMISLAVEYEDLSVIDRSIKETKSLRDIGLWYPEVPGRNLYLNDYPSSAANHSLTEHQPLSWILFGGPGGTYLRYVSGISVIFRRDTPRCIEFTYDLVDIELEDRMLGRRGLRGFDKAIHFPIDGAGGEIIEAVEVMLAHTDENDVHNSCKHPVPKAFRVLTNRGRRLNLEPPSGALYDEVQAIATAPGTTITGFYVSEHPAMGLISLGVISEIVHDDEKRGISLEAYKHLRELD